MNKVARRFEWLVNILNINKNKDLLQYLHLSIKVINYYYSIRFNNIKSLY